MKQIIYLFLFIILFSCGEEKRDTKEFAEEYAKKYCECLESELNDSEINNEDCSLELYASFRDDLLKENYSNEDSENALKMYEKITSQCQSEVDKIRNEARLNEIIELARSKYCNCMKDANDDRIMQFCKSGVRTDLMLGFSGMVDFDYSASTNEIKNKQVYSDERQQEIIKQVYSELDTACDN